MLIYAPFVRAVIDPDRPVPAGFVNPGKRFDVYRNNVAASLVAALAKTFPVIERMVGTAYFAALALAYVRQTPPRSPILAEYGKGFPAFIEAFSPLASYPYLADMARLELARIAVLHAPDGMVANDIGREADPAALLEASWIVSPAARLLASRYPVATLWERHQADGPQPLEAWPGESLLIFRADGGLVHALLSPGELAFLGALRGHATLGDALFALGDAQLAAEALRFVITLINAGALIAGSQVTGKNSTCEKV